MSRLIDADELIKEFDPNGERLDPILVRSRIVQQPTAYDLNAVVIQLEDEEEYSCADFEEYAKAYVLDLSEYDDWYFQGLKRAIEIVKRGGVE